MGIAVSDLENLLRQADERRIVLPNFQREYTYERKQQKELLISLFCGIPIGTILTLQGSKTEFKFRDVGRKSTVKTKAIHPDLIYLLDGQQRISTLWYALTDVFAGKKMAERDILFKDLNAKLRSRWFIQFKKRNENFEEDIWGLKLLHVENDLRAELLPESLEEYIVYEAALKSDGLNWGGSLEYSSKAKDKKQKKYIKKLEDNWYVPIHLMSNAKAFGIAVDWIANRRMMELAEDLFKLSREAYDGLSHDEKELLAKLLEINCEDDHEPFEMATIVVKLAGRCASWTSSIRDWRNKVMATSIGDLQLGDESMVKGHVIFDVINRSGVKLSTFDLFCATKPEQSVRSIVNSTVGNVPGMTDSSTGLVSDKYTNQLLNMLRIILADLEDDFNDQDVLKSRKIFQSWPDDSFQQKLPEAITALNAAYEFVFKSCGVRKISEMPYDLRILPIAFAYFKQKQGVQDSFVKYMYWLSLFGGRYRENQNARCLKDLRMVRGLSSDFDGLDVYEKDGDLFVDILNVQGYNDKEALIPSDDNYESKSNVNIGLLQYVLSKKPIDFPPGTDKLTTRTEGLEAHHIIPLGSTTTLEESTKVIRDDPTHYLNSPLNITLISRESNSKIGAMGLKEYSKYINDEVKRTHCLPDVPKELGESEAEEWNRDWLERRHSELKKDIKTRVESWYEQFSPAVKSD